MRGFSPAKINLSLRILGRRPDGFHELETLMAPLDFGDTLEVKIRAQPGVKIHCDEPGIPLGPENLVWKALAAFAEASATPLAYRVRLVKAIPAGAGLGGGSSNAATALLLANQLNGTPLDAAELTQLAGTIGADVAFFCAKSWAFCRGRGEIVEPCPAAGDFQVLLLKPPFPISTPWAYRNWRDSRELKGVSYLPQLLGNLELVNDLERPAFGKYLILAHLKSWLARQESVSAALMSGSGSTMFAIFKSGVEHADVVHLEHLALREFGEELWLQSARTVSGEAL